VTIALALIGLVAIIGFLAMVAHGDDRARRELEADLALLREERRKLAIERACGWPYELLVKGHGQKPKS
jgi:hypothetical protein